MKHFVKINGPEKPVHSGWSILYTAAQTSRHMQHCIHCLINVKRDDCTVKLSTGAYIANFHIVACITRF